MLSRRPAVVLQAGGGAVSWWRSKDRGTVVFEVIGTPVAKARPRVVRTKTGVRTYTPGKTAAWESRVRGEAVKAMRGQEPMEGPVKLVVGVIFEPPASWSAWQRGAAMEGRVAHTGKPDLDNIVKAVKDAMNGVVWGDDSQVIGVSAWKEYGSEAKVGIMVVPIDGVAPSNVSRKCDLA